MVVGLERDFNLIRLQSSPLVICKWMQYLSCKVHGLKSVRVQPNNYNKGSTKVDS